MDRYLELLKKQMRESKEALLIHFYIVPWMMAVTMLLGFFSWAASCLIFLLLAPSFFFLMDALVAFILYKYER